MDGPSGGIPTGSLIRVSPPISVIIPARDAEATLAQTLDSVQAQTVPPAQVIVVDDGSTDRTRDLAREHELGPEVVAGPGRGVAAARNAGLRMAGTDHVALLDADDWWKPWFLSEAQAIIGRTPSSAAVFLSASVVDDDGRPLGAHLLPDGDLTLEDLALGRFVPTASATVIRRDIVRELGGFYEYLERPAAEDLDLWFRLAERGVCASTSRVCAVYVMHEARDRARGQDELLALERDRERVVRRLAERGNAAAVAARATAIMRARTARYWLLTGRTGPARRIALRSLAAAPTVEGVLTLAAACTPGALREWARSVRRRHRARGAT